MDSTPDETTQGQDDFGIGADSPAKQIAAGASEPGQQTRRRHGRMRIENLPCNLGTVLDLSATGMRVLSSKVSAAKVDQPITVALAGTRGEFQFEGLVIWADRIGFRKHIVGVRFDDLDAEQHETIAQIARSYAVRYGLSA